MAAFLFSLVADWLEVYLLRFKPKLLSAVGTEALGPTGSAICFLLSNNKATLELHRKDKEGEGSLQPKARMSPRLEGKGVEV